MFKSFLRHNVKVIESYKMGFGAAAVLRTEQATCTTCAQDNVHSAVKTEIVP